MKLKVRIAPGDGNYPKLTKHQVKRLKETHQLYKIAGRLFWKTYNDGWSDYAVVAHPAGYWMARKLFLGFYWGQTP
jgi:hypothetical protein